MMRAHRASSSAPRTYAPDCVACSTMPNYQLTCCSPRRAYRRCIKRSRSADDFYWDGGYTGNPALAPLYLGTSATDLIVVGINPMERTTVPQTARGIIDRIDEISFNSTFMLELGAIAFVEHLMKSAAVKAATATPQRAWHRRRCARFVRRIEQDEQRLGVSAASAGDRMAGR